MEEPNRKPHREGLRFAPLVRVSTEKQERQGESLNTQKKQLQGAIDSLGGSVYRWYAGQEHATPAHERRILELLMKDATERKFDAVMVADFSRWSRDNEKSKEHSRLLKENGVRFFVGARELNLYDPAQAFLLGMSVEVAELFAGEQAYKSIINRIARAKKGHPACGKMPYGRIFNRRTGVWEVDEDAKRRVEEWARLYLQENVQFADLGKRFRVNAPYLNKLLKNRCGDKWQQRFQNKRCGIDETVVIDIPRLLPEEIIQQIRAKCEARRTWDHTTHKHEYLLSRIIFDKSTGYSLTGLPSHNRRYYRPYGGKGYLYMIRADLIEKAIADTLFEALCSNRAILRAVFDGRETDKIADELNAKKAVYEKELQTVEKKRANVRKAITALDYGEVDSFVSDLKAEIKDLEERRERAKIQIEAIDNRLSSLPTKQEIMTRRERMHEQLMKKIAESHFASGHTLESLPFHDKQRLLRQIFGGNDEDGERYGIYVTCLDRKEKSFRFEAYGRLGSLDGRIDARVERISSFADTQFFTAEDAKVPQLMGGIAPQSEMKETYKARMLCERHAHHGVRVHQRRRKRPARRFRRVARNARTS